MSDTIREQIIQAVMAKVANVTVSGGYNTNCGGNVQRVRKNLDPDELPAFVVWPGSESSERQYGRQENKMPVRIEGLSLFKGENPSAVSEKILGDIIKVMMADRTLGGLADDILYVSGGIDEYPDAGETATGCVVTFQIQYTTKIGNPYSQ